MLKYLPNLLGHVLCNLTPFFSYRISHPPRPPATTSVRSISTYLAKAPHRLCLAQSRLSHSNLVSTAPGHSGATKTVTTLSSVITSYVHLLLLQTIVSCEGAGWQLARTRSASRQAVAAVAAVAVMPSHPLSIFSGPYLPDLLASLLTSSQAKVDLDLIFSRSHKRPSPASPRLFFISPNSSRDQPTSPNHPHQLRHSHHIQASRLLSFPPFANLISNT